MKKTIVFLLIVLFKHGKDTASNLLDRIVTGVVTITSGLNEICLALTGVGLLPTILGSVLTGAVLSYIFGTKKSTLSKLLEHIIQKPIELILSVFNNIIFKNQ